jgi:cytochrome c oxidase assembly protein subunit 15
MTTHEKRIHTLFDYWLTSSLVLVFLTIIIGGLTRLTNSGLSITEWELFSGILPPLNNASWEKYFDLYKQIPQFKLINPNMLLSEFKIIFYWEYFHRILARLIGLFFLIPFIYFYFCKKINKSYLNNCLIIFFLIILQGLVGWYMVKSGLVNVVTVSHYRLSIHLSIALIIISLLFWLIINIRNNTHKTFLKFSKNNLPFNIFILIIFVQIIIGAFVSGLDAGSIYQTWPLMGNTYFPDDISNENLLNFSNHSLVQFYHRNLAYIIIGYIIILSFYIFKKEKKKLYKPLKIVLLILSFQVLMGIFTLLSGLNIFVASAHQITSVILVFAAINLNYLNAK